MADAPRSVYGGTGERGGGGRRVRHGRGVRLGRLRRRFVYCGRFEFRPPRREGPENRGGDGGRGAGVAAGYEPSRRVPRDRAADSAGERRDRRARRVVRVRGGGGGRRRGGMLDAGVESRGRRRLVVLHSPRPRRRRFVSARPELTPVRDEGVHRDASVAAQVLRRRGRDGPVGRRSGARRLGERGSPPPPPLTVFISEGAGLVPAGVAAGDAFTCELAAVRCVDVEATTSDASCGHRGCSLGGDAVWAVDLSEGPGGKMKTRAPKGAIPTSRRRTTPAVAAERALDR